MKINNFKIVIPVYNSDKWIGRTINSISKQTYKNWKAVIINDCSTDKTLDVIRDTLSYDPNKGNFSLFVRTINVGALENTVFGTNKICTDDEDIIIVVDGDDWLIDDKVLEYLNEVYQDDNICLTYGSYINLSNGRLGINKPIYDTRTYRKTQDYCTSHLRTYKFKVWKRINDNDLRDANKRYYRITGDLAVMFPMIEMCGIKRIKYIEKPLYVYNDGNPINDNVKNPSLQILINMELRNKSVYEEIP